MADLPWMLTEEEQSLCASIERFGRSLNSGLPQREAEGRFERALWRQCADLGLLGLPIPTEYGGSARNLTTTTHAMMALGRACRDNGLVFSLNAQLWAVELPLLHFGTEAQKQHYLPALCQGELIGAHAVTEPDAGSDVMSMATQAIREGDSYVLTGQKTFVTNGPVADVFLVFASIDRSLKSAGITGFLVDRDTPGLTVSPPLAKMGLRTSPTGELHLDQCRIPLANRLGAEGMGSAIFNSAMEWERTCIFAAHLGAMERLLADTIRYAKTRRQFGQPLIRHSPIADKLVNMKVAIEAGRLLLLKAAATKDAGQNALLEAAIAKLFVSEAHLRQTLDAVHIHGGYGYMSEYQIERELRDAVPGTIYSGTSEMQRKIIARLLETI